MRPIDAGADDPIDWLLVERHLAGETTADEASRLAVWMRASPGRAEYIESLRSLTGLAEARQPTFDSARGWSRMRADIDPQHAVRDGGLVTPESIARRTNHAVPGPQSWPQGVGARPSWRWAAATTFVLAGLVIGGVVSGALRRRLPGAASQHEYVAAAGQRLSVTLVDGTRMTLAPASRVRLAAGYRQGTRDLEIEGEAYFAVAHDSGHPFVVRARGVVARDVGTEFDIRAYPEDVAVRVTVADGRVSLTRNRGFLAARSAAGAMVLVRGDVATASDTSIAVRHGADIARLTGWLQGHLVFTGTPLRDVARELSRTFDLSVTLADSTLGEKLITGNFEGHAVNDILGDITMVIGARYDRAGRRVTIRPGTPATAAPGDQRPAVQTTLAREPGQ